jgi:hypothetical protein
MMVFCGMLPTIAAMANAQPLTYDSVKIAISDGTHYTAINKLLINLDRDTTLHALGLRSDGSGIWDILQVNWGHTAGMSLSTPPPGNSASWTFGPTDTAGGKIFIALNTGGRLLTDSITAFLPYDILPPWLVLYPAAGPPPTVNTAYPPQVFDTVGQTLPLVAKVFNRPNVWLADYERPDAPISWKVEELTWATGSGVLDMDSGFQVNFTGLKAYQTVRVIATLYCGSPCAFDTIIITILPKPFPPQLVIEPDSLGPTAYPHTPHRAGQVTLGATETKMTVYAVLRDVYGNFIHFSDSTIWTSRDTSIIRATSGNTSIGEGILTRSASMGQTYVIAQNKSNPAIKDSVLVQLSYISYRSITFETMTPPGKRFAGDTISYRLQIRGTDGLDTTRLCDSVMFQKNLVSLPGQPEPFVIVNNTRMPFNAKTPVCSDSGQFLIKAVLYSITESLYRIDMNFSKLTVFHDTFTLVPAAVGRVEIQRRVDSSSVDSVYLSYPGGNIALTCVGYDAFGNKRGLEKANWNTTGTLHSIIQSKNMSMIYCDASTVTGEEEGYIYCSPVSDSTIRDSVKIRIAGPAGVLPKNRAPQAHYLRFITQNFGAYIFPLPADVAHSRLFLSLYSLSGKAVFTTEIFDAEKPVSMKSLVEPGIYIASVRTAERQLVKGRCVFVK